MSANDPVTQPVNGSPEVPVQTQTKKKYFIEMLREAKRGCVLNTVNIEELLEYFEAQ